MLLFVFVVGCGIQQTQEKFNVSLANVRHEGVFVLEQNKTLDEISFIIKNNEKIDLLCNVSLNLSNGSNFTAVNGAVGVLGPRQQKKISLKFEMFAGETKIVMGSVCSRNTVLS